MNLQDIGNGYGYIYCTAVDGTTIKFTEGNDKYGVQNIKNRAVGSSPVVASRSATGTITISACAAVGAITDITVCGISILGAPIPCTTIVPEEFATLIGQTINSFVSAPDFTAQAIGPTIYIFSPLTSPETYNGCNIVVDVNTGTITATTTLMTSGVTNNEAYDLTLGARYMLNADYNSSYVTNTLAAVPTALGNYIEITKQIISRGTNVGGSVNNVSVDGDTLVATNRVSAGDVYIVDTQGAAATDYLVAINPDGFMQGDRVFLRGKTAAHVVTLVSIPNAGLVSPVVQPNIVLTADTDFVTSNDAVGIDLMFIYSNDLQQYVFTEIGRTTASVGLATNIGTGLETYNTASFPFEFRTSKLLPSSNLLADYGYQTAQTGTEIQTKYNPLLINTVYVDAVYGLDATGIVFSQDKKYQTIGGAVLAITAYRAATMTSDWIIVEIAPGYYTESTPFTEQYLTFTSSSKGYGSGIMFSPAVTIDNAGALDSINSIQFSGDIAILSSALNLTWTNVVISVRQINILAPATVSITLSQISSYSIFISVPALTLPIMIEGYSIGIFATTITASVNSIVAADIVQFSSYTNTTISIQNLEVRAHKLSYESITTATITNGLIRCYYLEAFYCELNTSNTKMEAMKMTLNRLFINTASSLYVTADEIVFTATAANQAALAGGLIYLSAKNIVSTGMEVFYTVKGGSIIVENKVTLARNVALHSPPALTLGNGLVTDFIYKAAITELTANGGLIANIIDVQFAPTAQVVIDTFFRNTGTAYFGFAINDVVTTNAEQKVSFKGRYVLAGQDSTFIGASTMANLCIDADIYAVSGTCVRLINIADCQGVSIMNKIKDSSTSSVTISVNSACTETIIDAKIVKTNAGPSIGNLVDPAITVPINFESKACSNIAYAIADVVLGDITSATAPEYDLVVNANIV